MGLKPFRVYIDSCIAIYLVEEHPVFAPKIETKVANIDRIEICVSDLTELECLVLPLRNDDAVLLTKFRNWFDKAETLPAGKDIFRNAAQLRADFPTLKTPDALHLASALYHNCDEFWTNDNRLTGIAPAIVKNILTP